jgi:hypothetical protein
MKRYCPNCGNQMMADEMNPVSDLAKCDDCGTLTSIHALDYKPFRQPNLYEVPDGSKFQISQGTDKSLGLYYPPIGWNWFHLFLIPFVLFWVSFVGFWTFMSMKVSYLISLFSIPFWYVGISMLKGVYLNIRGWEQVRINKNAIEIITGHGNRSKTRTIPLREVIEIALHYKTDKGATPSEGFRRMKIDAKKKRTVERQPAVVLLDEKIFIFEAASDLEQDWIIALLNDIKSKLS